MANLEIKELDDGVVFKTKIVPGSSRTTLSGLLDGMLKIKVSAAPEKGKANQSVIEFLARQLGVKKNSIEIISGTTKSHKSIKVSDMSAQTLLKKLNLNQQ